jgi:hypothetical protein
MLVVEMTIIDDVVSENTAAERERLHKALQWWSRYRERLFIERYWESEDGSVSSMYVESRPWWSRALLVPKAVVRLIWPGFSL